MLVSGLRNVHRKRPICDDESHNSTYSRPYSRPSSDMKYFSYHSSFAFCRFDIFQRFEGENYLAYFSLSPPLFSAFDCVFSLSMNLCCPALAVTKIDSQITNSQSRMGRPPFRPSPSWRIRWPACAICLQAQ